MNRSSRGVNGQHVYLKPGELFFSRQPAVVTTVLGSCISATFLHRSTGCAAICHAIQPHCPHPGHCQEACEMAGRYAVCAIEAMIRRMAAAGVRPRDIEIKLFGGAAMIVRSSSRPASVAMGQQNVIAAMHTINKDGLILKVADVGGTFGRKIIFYTNTGEILLKRLGRMSESDASLKAE
jgi:chemotaxis protein CheD